MKTVTLIILLLFPCVISVRAALELTVGKPKTYTRLTVIKMDLHNSFADQIKSAEAVVFLMSDKGKVVGQKSRWIFGGPDRRPPLPPGSNTTFFFVVSNSQSFATAKVLVTRIVFENGKLGNILRDVKTQNADGK
jgi:hypothetical protein